MIDEGLNWGCRLSILDWFPPELVCVNHRVEDGDEFPHRSCERYLHEFSLRQQALIEGFDRRVESRGNEGRHVQRAPNVATTSCRFSFAG